MTVKTAAVGYEVRWRKNSDPVVQWSTSVAVGADGHVSVPGLERVTDYTFEARAVSACGAKSAWVTQTFNLPASANPAAVTSLTAQSIADGVHLSWTFGAQAPDTRFSIERSTSASSGFAERVQVTGTAYTDPEPTGTTFYYRVRATNYASSFGPYSNVVSSNGVAVDDLGDAVDALQTAVTEAQHDADTANVQLATIASDNTLSPAEKPTVMRDYAVITMEQAGIDGQATAYSVTTQKTAYDSAVTTLTAYLDTLTMPTAWNDKSGNTTIDGPTFRGKFADVYTARQALLNAIYAQARAWAALSLAPGQNMIPNPSFAIGNSTNTPLKWTLANGPNTTSSCASNTHGMRTALQIATAATTPTTVICMSDFFPLPTSGPISIQCRYDIDGTYDAGDAASDILFWDSTKAVYIGHSARIFTAAANTPDQPGGYLAQLPNQAIPAGAAFGRLRVFIENAQGQSGATVYVHVTNYKVEVGGNCTAFSDDATTFGHDLVVSGSGQTVGDQRNLQPVTWAGVRSVLSASPIAYSVASSGTTVTFTVAAVSVQAGGFTVSYSASSGSVTQAAGTTVTYYLYYRDPTSAGGSKTLNITTSVQALAAYGDIVLLGSADVTVNSGGGGTSGGGSGGGGWCVCGDMWVDPAMRARDAPLGYLFDCCDLIETGLATYKRPLLACEVHVADCVQLTTAGGAVWRGGVTTPFDVPDGRTLRAPEMRSELVLTDRGLERVAEVRAIGKQVVYFNHFGGISYACGADPRHRVYSHNPGQVKP